MPFKKSRRAIRSLIDNVFDYEEAAALALGPVWKARTPDERVEFIALFANILERNFIAMAGAKVSVVGGLQVDYVAESAVGDGATVSTTMLTRSGTELPVDYSMLRRDGRWMVRDVIIQGVGLVATYQSQFAQFLNPSAYPALVQRMRASAPEARPAGNLIASASTAPAPPRAVKPPTPVSPPATGHFWVQVGAFKSTEAAARVAEELRTQGMPASSGPLTSVPGQQTGQLARVRVGPFPTRAAATSKLRELVARGYAPFISKDRD